jgi:squalene-hopene/tetraprenyl-beta-curcumene cyclase
MNRILKIALLTALLSACSSQTAQNWSPGAASTYLDMREVKWSKWGPAARANGTVCVSCHTSLVYALARPRLEATLQQPPAAPRLELLANVQKRVRLWSQIPPYYPDHPRSSRDMEVVLNALILADEDKRHGALGVETQSALDDMWSLQVTSGPDAGSWPWLHAGNEPFEANESDYFGATLAALAVGATPEEYRARPALQANLELLRSYLVRGYPQQTLFNKIQLLWAGSQWPGLVTPAMRDEVEAQIWAQQRPDGGWRLASLIPDWKRRDGRALSSDSDGYATGLITLVLQDSGLPRTDARLGRGLSWLQSHQSSWNGRWMATSPNRSYGYFGEQRHFMDDAATAFAVLALTEPPAAGPLHAGNQTSSVGVGITP